MFLLSCYQSFPPNLLILIAPNTQWQNWHNPASWSGPDSELNQLAPSFQHWTSNTCRGFIILAKTSTDSPVQLSDRRYKAPDYTASSGGCRQPVSPLIWMTPPQHLVPLTHPFTDVCSFRSSPFLHSIPPNGHALQCHPFSIIYPFCLTWPSNTCTLQSMPF